MQAVLSLLLKLTGIYTLRLLEHLLDDQPSGRVVE
jgi:hypothetical protein